MQLDAALSFCTTCEFCSLQLPFPLGATFTGFHWSVLKTDHISRTGECHWILFLNESFTFCLVFFIIKKCPVVWCCMAEWSTKPLWNLISECTWQEFITSFPLWLWMYYTVWVCVCVWMFVCFLWWLKVKKTPTLSSAFVGKPPLGTISKVSSTVTPKVCVFLHVCVCLDLL